MTAASERATMILQAHPDGLTARQFASLMWTVNPAWYRMSKIGRGATRGVGMWRAGGGYLGRLVKQGIASRRLTMTSQYIYTAALPVPMG